MWPGGGMQSLGDLTKLQQPQQQGSNSTQTSSRNNGSVAFAVETQGYKIHASLAIQG